MSSLLYTVQNLIDEVRAQLDEENRDSVSTESDILPTLNRAQDYAFDILSRKYEEPILTNTTLSLSANQSEYDIPENVFEDRIQKIEIRVPSGAGYNYREVRRISYRDITNYETGSNVSIPYYYSIYSRKMRIIPTPNGTYDARVWYLRNPEKLVLPQGRITVVNSVSNYVNVDSIGDLLTTESDNLGSYVNVIDGQTGEIKGSLQIQSLANNRITFRTVPNRASVLNRTIAASTSTVSAALDDYLAPIDGTCVPYYSRPISNFLIEYSVAEITRKLGGESDKEEKVLEKFEKQVERTWAGRETTLRIKKKSHIWAPFSGRWFRS